MFDDLWLDDIDVIEFCVAIDVDDRADYCLVPCDQTVLVSLHDMLTSTVLRLRNHCDDINADALPEFEPSEKYGPDDCAIAPLAKEWTSRAKELFELEGLPSDAGAVVNSLDRIAFYFCIFRNKKGEKLVGVKRAIRFRGVLEAKLLTFVDDSLRLVGDKLLRLDRDFDFLVTSANVYVAHATAFEYVAEIGTAVAAGAKDKLAEIVRRIEFLDLARVEALVTKKRVSRLLAAIAGRPDLDKIRRENLIAFALQTGVKLVDGELVAPEVGHEEGLLQLLDYRRYSVTLTDDLRAFVADSRRRVN